MSFQSKIIWLLFFAILAGCQNAIAMHVDCSVHSPFVRAETVVAKFNALPMAMREKGIIAEESYIRVIELMSQAQAQAEGCACKELAEDISKLGKQLDAYSQSSAATKGRVFSNLPKAMLPIRSKMDTCGLSRS